MKFWMGLQFQPLDDLKPLARAAEQAGFTGITLGGHVITHVERKPGENYPYRGTGKGVFSQETQWPDPITTMAMLAEVTQTLRFTTTVLVLPLYNPFTIAKQLSTAAVFSDNRVTLGIGVGWQASEFKVLQQAFHTRGRRTDEMLEVMRKLMSGQDVEHHGEFYDFDWLHMLPAPSEPVPIYVGGESDAALRRAARNDGWIGTTYDDELLAKTLGRLEAARRAEGSLDRDFLVMVGEKRKPDLDLYRKLEDMGVNSMMASPWMQADEPDAQFTLEEKLRAVEDFGKRFIR
ncbi:MAG: TIGR03619 family F420-dependent LLM class oxidoreductase [Novosphingobium sp.]|nr:TIGR03619 family F420-dependent LLM class oxidoreductase [Novosphingobium sp.]MCP5402939.1 TIGR03619 family F420-dependent LLM class oxidoreductase [Novosphingobium sp.]